MNSEKLPNSARWRADLVPWRQRTEANSRPAGRWDPSHRTWLASANALWLFEHAVSGCSVQYFTNYENRLQRYLHKWDSNHI